MEEPVYRGGTVCAPMPVLVLRPGDDVFRPAWRLPHATVSGGAVCFPAEEGAILRVGRGWGRRGGDRYYRVTRGGVEKLRRRAVKTPGGGWRVCVTDGREWLCFALTERGIARC